MAGKFSHTNNAQLCGQMADNNAQLGGPLGRDKWPAPHTARGALSAPREVQVEGKRRDGRPYGQYVSPYVHSFAPIVRGDHMRDSVAKFAWTPNPIQCDRSNLLFRTTGNVLLERLPAIVRDSYGNDPRSVLRFDRSRVVLPKVVAQNLRIDPNLCGQLLRSERFRVRHGDTSLRMIVCGADVRHPRAVRCASNKRTAAAIDDRANPRATERGARMRVRVRLGAGVRVRDHRYSVPDAYAFECKCSFDPPIVRTFEHSCGVTRVRSQIRKRRSLLSMLTTRDAPLPTHEGGIDADNFSRGAKREGRAIFSHRSIHVCGRRVR